MIVLLVLYIFLGFIVPIPGYNGFFELRNILLSITGIFLILSILKNKDKINEIAGFLIVYIVIAVFVNLQSEYPSATATGIQGFRMHFGVIAIGLAMIIFYPRLYKNQSKNLVVKTLYYSLIVQIIWGIAEYLGFYHEYDFSKYFAYPITSFGRNGFYGMFFLLIGNFVFVNSSKNKLWIWMITVLGIALSTNTTATLVIIILALIYGLLFWFLEKNRKLAILIILCTPVIITAAPKILTEFRQTLEVYHIVEHKELWRKDLLSTNTLKTRLLLWKSAWDMFKSKPIFGWGDQQFNFHLKEFLTAKEYEDLVYMELGLSRSRYKLKISESIILVTDLKKNETYLQPFVFSSPHNVILEELIGHGIVGLTLLLIFWVLYIKHSIRQVGLKRTVWYFLPFFGYFMMLQTWFFALVIYPIGCALLGYTLYLIDQEGEKRRDIIEGSTV